MIQSDKIYEDNVLIIDTGLQGRGNGKKGIKNVVYAFETDKWIKLSWELIDVGTVKFAYVHGIKFDQ